MNKLYVMSVLVFTSITFVNAQEATVTSGMMRGAPSRGPITVSVDGVQNNGQGVQGGAGVRPGMGRPMLVRASSSQQDQNNPQGGGFGQTGTSIMPARPPLPTTGNVAIDAQIRLLVQERDTKIKAIDDEYRTKIEALIGTRPLKAFPVNASGTMMRDNRFPQAGDIRPDGRSLGSSTEATMVQGNGNPRMNSNPPNQAPRPPRIPVYIGQEGGATQTIGQGVGAQFNALFQGIFGGNK